MTKEKEVVSDKRPGLGRHGNISLFCSGLALSVLSGYISPTSAMTQLLTLLS